VLDVFKVIIAVAVVLSLVFLGVILAISINAIDNAAIPDIQYGQVTAKAPADADTDFDYVINLAEGNKLYIVGNQTLYDSVQLNMTYVFSCRIDYTNQLLIAESAWQTNRTET